MTLRRFSQESGTSTALAITLANLANGSARESLAINNAAANKYQDALVSLRVKLVAGAPGNEYRVYVYAYGSEDGNSYTSPATGANAALTLTTPTTLALIGIMEIRSNAGTPIFASLPMSVAAAFGWSLPRKWGIVVANRAGRAFAAADCAASYSGIYQGLE